MGNLSNMLKEGITSFNNFTVFNAQGAMSDKTIIIFNLKMFPSEKEDMVLITSLKTLSELVLIGSTIFISIGLFPLVSDQNQRVYSTRIDLLCLYYHQILKNNICF